MMVIPLHKDLALSQEDYISSPVAQEGKLRGLQNILQLQTQTFSWPPG